MKSIREIAPVISYITAIINVAIVSVITSNWIDACLLYIALEAVADLLIWVAYFEEEVRCYTYTVTSSPEDDEVYEARRHG